MYRNQILLCNDDEIVFREAGRDIHCCCPESNRYRVDWCQQTEPPRRSRCGWSCSTTHEAEICNLDYLSSLEIGEGKREDTGTTFLLLVTYRASARD